MKITINNQKIAVKEGQTILEVARQNKIDIPTLCYHSDLTIQASCRLCLVEIEGRPGLYTSCSTKVEDGLVVKTESENIARARKINLELLFAQHREECADCIYHGRCQALKICRQLKGKINGFTDRKKDKPTFKFGPALEFDSSKCIDCRLCVDMCHRQGIDFLELEYHDGLYEVVPSKDPKKDCIYCGQCLMHCPVGAFEGVGEYEAIEKPLQEEGKTVVFQFAPSIRTTIGEEFGMPYGSVVTGHLFAGIHALGAKAFDTSIAADVTTVEEAKELVERLEKKEPLPMFTSCCPGWVKFCEFYYPEFIPNLTTVRSPHMIMGGLIKTYWAQKEGLDPKNIIVVSIMPCLAKKYDITREELWLDKGALKPVDYVLTTREFAQLLRKRKINLKEVKPEEPVAPFPLPTGAGVIYGASGGVMESALRTAYEKITGKTLPQLEFKNVRGLQGVKKAVVDIAGRKLKVAVVNGTINARKILAELKIDPHAYDYIEVMACLGGCIGGGGQPVPVNEEIRQQRAASLYQVDEKSVIRCAHNSPFVKNLYQEYFNNQDNIKKICHTTFKKKNKEVNR
ncbi:MAG: hypothetical protein A2233_00940 [Candidatus Kerfeldbacteria bacterium RIFOXYA2_FULL_38_24]|uniref:Ferredoxin n=1 Tax=Candidatus Kerfeldbacteria bacterium RIFOXYB2_FULL_38_14 TaxID=1798547 RepID=A0A1G2BHX4_9BACT|nr:MAG: hypothetical protein A2233_00940 [Candidatus Kerfeldbacteria bacterium RIFOXYA2_FULL_38_24]OGY88119.1 MAG: hypothetical protein A2319_01670 [Candidatus Kerfeldbacteria bacterium RIFOXYB2_FULL_38_14]OGY89601.1 MAG: hypothetical protein A2458_04135 [Candidatus Kerfeldbacteria bacterium RIFOXYC2_FULL_38_9]